MTLQQTRLKAGLYSSVHLETGRTFEIHQKSGTYEWYAIETTGDKRSKPISFKDVWAKKTFLARLEDLISNPPKPPAPKIAPKLEKAKPQALSPVLIKLKQVNLAAQREIPLIRSSVKVGSEVFDLMGYPDGWAFIDRHDRLVVPPVATIDLACEELARVTDAIERIPRTQMGESGRVVIRTSQKTATITFTAGGQSTETVVSNVERVNVAELKRIGYAVEVAE